MSHSNPEPAFPPIVRINGRNYVQRGVFEQYKADLVRHSLGGRSASPPPPPPEHDALVPFKVVSQELGVGRRTIGRWLKAATSDAAVDAA
jgi:hypothetical protein